MISEPNKSVSFELGSMWVGNCPMLIFCNNAPNSHVTDFVWQLVYLKLSDHVHMDLHFFLLYFLYQGFDGIAGRTVAA